MKLVWKLLRHHISVPQFVGFFFANLMGVLIVILGFQFYRDVEPVFTQPDSFMSADYLIISKQISIGNTLSGQSNTFTGAEINDISSQRFVNKTGQFTSTLYNVSAYMGVGGSPILSSEIFLKAFRMILWMLLRMIGHGIKVVVWYLSSCRVHILICIISDSPNHVRYLRSAKD